MMRELPRAMLIDMDDTILSAYARPDLAWNNVAAEFESELTPLLPQQVAAAIVDFGRKFWATAEPAWRLKLAEARHEVVRGGFAALAEAGHLVLPRDLGIRLADRFTVYREEQMFVFPGAHDHGFGKPEERAYLHAMQALGVTARETWMVGDNLEWEVEAPQRLGIYAIWLDAHGQGLPAQSAIRPDRIIRSLTELLPADRG